MTDLIAIFPWADIDLAPARRQAYLEKASVCQCHWKVVWAQWTGVWCPSAEDTHHAVHKKRVSEPSRHPLSQVAPFYLQLLAADWMMTSCITLNHSFSVSAASRTSWLDTQECDAPGFICIKGRVQRKRDEPGIDLGGEPDGEGRRRHAIQK